MMSIATIVADEVDERLNGGTELRRDQAPPVAQPPPKHQKHDSHRKEGEEDGAIHVEAADREDLRQIKELEHVRRCADDVLGGIALGSREDQSIHSNSLPGPRVRAHASQVNSVR